MLCSFVVTVEVVVPSSVSSGGHSSSPAGVEGLGWEASPPAGVGGLGLLPSFSAGLEGLGPEPTGFVSEGVEPPPPFSAGGVAIVWPPSVTGQTVVEMAMICVVTEPILPGQSVTVGAHDVTV